VQIHCWWPLLSEGARGETRHGWRRRAARVAPPGGRPGCPSRAPWPPSPRRRWLCSGGTKKKLSARLASTAANSPTSHPHVEEMRRVRRRSSRPSFSSPTLCWKGASAAISTATPPIVAATPTRGCLRNAKALTATIIVRRGGGRSASAFLHRPVGQSHVPMVEDLRTADHRGHQPHKFQGRGQRRVWSILRRG